VEQNSVGVWRALFGWIDRPRKTLRYVIREPRWSLSLAPALIIVVSLIIVTVISAPALSEFSREQAERQIATQAGSIPEEQADQVQRTLDLFTSPLFLAATGIAMGTLGLVLTWLLRGGVLFFLSYLLGTDNRFRQMVTLVMWTWLPFALRDLVQAVYILINGQLPLNKGLSFLVASSDQAQNAGNIAYGFLSQVDPFLAWHLFLVAVGLTLTTRSTTLKTAVGTIIYWVLTAVVGMAPSLLGMLAGSAF
jgi:hypothetical protein